MDSECWNLVGRTGKVIRKTACDQATADYNIDLVRSPLSLAQGRAAIATKQEQICNQVEFLAFAKQQVQNAISDLCAVSIDHEKEEKKTFYFVVYGIGRLLQSRVAQYQAAFLNIMKQWLSEIISELWKVEYILYDPVLRKQEKVYFRENGWLILDVDENCKRTIGKTDRAIFYMPHGEKFMYCNLIQTNVSNMDRLVIVGNSFNNYNDTNFSRKKRKEIKPILNILPLCVESPFPIWKSHPDIFNNTCFMRFTKRSSQHQTT